MRKLTNIAIDDDGFYTDIMYQNPSKKYFKDIVCIRPYTTKMVSIVPASSRKAPYPQSGHLIACYQWERELLEEAFKDFKQRNKAKIHKQ